MYIKKKKNKKIEVKIVIENFTNKKTKSIKKYSKIIKKLQLFLLFYIVFNLNF
jgi:hypothetical protein